MLGMYVHTHWAYNHPYAARTWTFADWERYLAGLSSLGYDMIMVWPLLDCMPPEPAASDRAFLATLSRVIELAHDRYGMKVVITAAPNTIGNDASAAYSFTRRPYFVCEKKVNPKDRLEVEAFLQGRRNQFEALRHADALAVIDSDPGGYIGSTNDEFVALVKGQIDALRSFNPRAELIYWMLAGWENYNRFWAAAQNNPDVNMWDAAIHREQVFPETLRLMKAAISEPWSVFTLSKTHRDAVAALGLADKAMAFPYAVIEGEPSFPLTNFDPGETAQKITTALAWREPRGIMANAQTHCLQLPHTYLFAHVVRGGTAEDADWEGFAGDLLPELGPVIARGWRATGARDPVAQRKAAVELRSHAGQSRPLGRLAGLLFGDADRFLMDLVMNLELRAALIDMKTAIDSGGRTVAGAVRRVLDILRPYQQRLGFGDAYGGPLSAELNRNLQRLQDDALSHVLKEFNDWRKPAIRHGIVPRLLDAMERYCCEHGG